jgi:uncharacterized protein (DUF2267 family)
MDYENFIALVEKSALASREEAERAVRATLKTLAERLSGGEARDIAAELPPELRPLLEDGRRAEPFDLREFLRRVAEREGVPQELAARHARAVFVALGVALSADELHDLASELPNDFGDLLAIAIDAHAFAAARVTPSISAEDFYDRVARRAGLDRDGARSTTDAVLEALAIRVSGGEVDDLEGQLPPELGAPLERGKAESRERAEKLSLDDFLDLIARREGSTRAEAREHARAVLATLREAITEKEWRDVRAQLPREYSQLLAESIG